MAVIDKKYSLLSDLLDNTLHQLLRHNCDLLLSLSIGSVFLRFANCFFAVLFHRFPRFLHLLLVLPAILINLFFHRLDLVDAFLNARHELADIREFLEF